jgi:hypothetical protein
MLFTCLPRPSLPLHPFFSTKMCLFVAQQIMHDGSLHDYIHTCFFYYTMSTRVSLRFRAPLCGFSLTFLWPLLRPSPSVAYDEYSVVLILPVWRRLILLSCGDPVKRVRDVPL